MTAKELREAAERVIAPPYDYGSPTREYTTDAINVADHILANVQEDGEEPVTGWWLKEKYGFENIPGQDDDEYYLDHNYHHYSMLLNGEVGTFYLDCEDGDAWPHDIHSRQQAADLFKCLDIKPKS